MRFLVMLVRDRWLPDAVAQMKFTPKRRGVEIGRMLRVSSFLLEVIGCLLTFLYLSLLFLLTESCRSLPYSV